MRESKRHMVNADNLEDNAMKPRREVGLDDIEGLMRKVQDRQRSLIIAVLAQAVLILFLCVIVGVLAHSLTVRDTRRSVTIDVLAAFAENNNCVNQRSEAFETAFAKYATSQTPADRAAAVEFFTSFPKCNEVVLPGIPKSKTQHSTTTTTKETSP